jgi:hypothetical protein
MNKRAKKLTIAKETLHNLSAVQLTGVAGGFSLYGHCPETSTCNDWSRNPCPSLHNSDCSACTPGTIPQA